MSSNIRLQRTCYYCSNTFTARTIATKFCTSLCSKMAYKTRLRDEKFRRIKNQSIEELKAKEFLTVRDVAALLSCSHRSIYYYLEKGYIEAVNFGERITRVKRSSLDKLFEKPQSASLQTDLKQFDISECYTLAEVQSKYAISKSALQQIINRYEIPKIKKGWFVYVPKNIIDLLFS